MFLIFQSQKTSHQSPFIPLQPTAGGVLSVTPAANFTQKTAHDSTRPSSFMPWASPLVDLVYAMGVFSCLSIQIRQAISDVVPQAWNDYFTKAIGPFPQLKAA
jgi:hypothetical protein